MLATLYAHIGKWIYHNPLKVLFLSLLFTGIGGYFTAQIRIQADLKELLPAHFDSVRGLDELKNRYGGIGYLTLGLEVHEPKDAIAFLNHLVPTLLQIPEVRYVNYQRPIHFFIKHFPFYLELDDLQLIEQRLQTKKAEMTKGANPIFDELFFTLDEGPTFDDILDKYERRQGLDMAATEYYQNEEGTFFAVLIKPTVLSSNLAESRRFVAAIESVVRRLEPARFGHGVTVTYGGDFKGMLEQEQHLKNEMARISGIVMLLLMLVLILYYRRISPVIVIGIPLFCGIVWTGGIVYFLLGHVNLVTGFSASVLSGLGSDYGIYLLTRFLQEREGGHSSVQAFRNTFSRTSKATRGSAITTMVAFGALACSNFRGFSEFGLIGLIGTFLNLIAMHLQFPALVAFADRQGILRWEQRFFPWHFQLHIKRTRLRLALPLVVIFLTLGVFAALRAPTILPIDYDLAQFQNSSLASYHVDKKVSAVFQNSLHPAVIIVEGGESHEREILTAIKKAAAQPHIVPMIQEGLGIMSFLPPDQDAKEPLIRQIQELLRDMRLPALGRTRDFMQQFLAVAPRARVTRANLPQEVVQLFVRPEAKESFVYLFPRHPRDSTERVKAFAEQTRNIPLPDGKTITALGDTLIIADILALVEREAPWILGLILLFCFLDLAVEFKDVSSALLLIAMLAFALLIFLGGMAYFDLRFNFFNLAAPPIIIGTGCNSFIHFYHRQREHRHQVIATLNSMVPSITIANLTTMIGFGGLTATDNGALRSMGWLVALGMVTVTLTVLLFLPAALTLNQQWKSRRA